MYFTRSVLYLDTVPISAETGSIMHLLLYKKWVIYVVLGLEVANSLKETMEELSIVPFLD